MARKRKSYEETYPFDIEAMAKRLRGETPEIKVPDLSEAVPGWRAWGVETSTPRFGNVPLLQAVTHAGYVWTPGVPARAECDRSRRSSGPDHVPGEQCSCGFYSAKSLGHLMSMSYHQYDAESRGLFHIVGKVANWGKVVEGTQGWRAEYCYPIALFVPFEAHYLAEPLSLAYGVPVRLKNILGVTELLNQRRMRRKP
jgi:hypothetical protein